MPIDRPQSMAAEDIYAVLAYLFSVDGIVEEDATLDKEVPSKLRMPNQDGFISQWPPAADVDDGPRGPARPAR